jgi:D-alanyl-D-alanine carboxypeptidase (penicillin-binding protein 5/6)
MLPSGNDMSVALAEHFGARLAPVVTADTAADNTATTSDADIAADAKASIDPLTQFVAAMNAEAARLGMAKTRFSNPHGLSTDTHLSTANDLAILARTALKNDLFRHYVSTRQRGATVTGPGGYSRHVHVEEHESIVEPLMDTTASRLAQQIWPARALSQRPNATVTD